MSYESKIFVVRKHDYLDGMFDATIITFLDLGNLDFIANSSDYYDCFDTDIPFKLYLPRMNCLGDEILANTNEDRYNCKMQYVSLLSQFRDVVNDMIDNCDNKEVKKELKIIKKLIKLYKDDESIYFVNYGY